LEVDSLGITTGAASLQTPGATLASSQGYGFNLTGENANVGEVDDIAEFSTSSSGDTITGIIDENTEAGQWPDLWPRADRRHLHFARHQRPRPDLSHC